MLTAISCDTSNQEGAIMPHGEMVNYLIELHLAEAQVQNLRLKKDSSKVVFDIYEKYLLDKHNISDSVFIRSYNYYLEHPGELESIYETVVDSLSVRKSIVDVTK